MLIISRVESVVEEYGTRDPFKICNMMGIEVLCAPLDGLRGLYLREKDVDTITIDAGLSELASRFVCAHELGHALMHRGINRLFMDRYTFMETGRYEREADKFAAHLMLAGAEFIQGEDITIWEMADILNVDALRTRIHKVLCYNVEHERIQKARAVVPERPDG